MLIQKKGQSKRDDDKEEADNTLKKKVMKNGQTFHD